MRRVRLAGVLFISAAGLLLFPLGSFGRASDENTWSGTWNTNFNTMTLKQSGASVEGNYAYDDGHLKGAVTAKVFKGRWDEAPTRKGPNDAGPFEFTMSSDGKSFTGRWRHDGDAGWAGNWNGTCTRGLCLDNVAGGEGERTVRFLFTQAGLPKREEIKDEYRLLEYRTVGSGRGRATGRNGNDNFTPTTARIVRELDFLDIDPDRKGFQRKTVQLVFRFRADGEHSYRAPSRQLKIVRLELDVASSSDPTCPRVVAGRVRQAAVIIWDNAGIGPDSVELVVADCPHHKTTFIKKRDVKVAIIELRP